MFALQMTDFKFRNTRPVSHRVRPRRPADSIIWYERIVSISWYHLWWTRHSFQCEES